MSKLKILKRIFGVLALGSLATTITFSALSSYQSGQVNKLRKNFEANVELNQQIVSFEEDINNKFINGEITKDDFISITSTLHGEERIEFYIKNYCTDQKFIDEYNELVKAEEKESDYTKVAIGTGAGILATGTIAYALSEMDEVEEVDEFSYSTLDEEDFYEYEYPNIRRKEKISQSISDYQDDLEYEDEPLNLATKEEVAKQETNKESSK